MSKDSFKLEPVSGVHFYAASFGVWMTGSDVEELIKKMKLHGMNFAVWLVPGPPDMAYEIRNFRPKVEGIIHLGTYVL